MMPELNFVSHDPSEIIPTCWLCKGKAFILLKRLYEHNKIKLRSLTWALPQHHNKVLFNSFIKGSRSIAMFLVNEVYNLGEKQRLQVGTMPKQQTKV